MSDLTAYRSEVIDWALDLDTTPTRRGTLLYLVRRMDEHDRFRFFLSDMAEHFGIAQKTAWSRFHTLAHATRLVYYLRDRIGDDYVVSGEIAYPHSPRVIAHRTRSELFHARLAAKHDLFHEAEQAVADALADVSVEEDPHRY